MTERQEKILRAGLRLFATDGFSSTSTSKVAREAGVSEGLIFRHFKNKEGLLQAIMERSQEAAKRAMADVVMSGKPREVIRKMLELPFQISRDQYEMWRLTYALKWQTDQYQSDFHEPAKLVLQNAFKELGYADPAAETELLYMYIDGAATALLLHEPDRKEAILKALKSKYGL